MNVLQLLLCFTVQVEAATPLTVLALARDTFLSVLGPLEELMTREKSPQVGGMYRQGIAIPVFALAGCRTRCPRGMHGYLPNQHCACNYMG
jgi:hypothetical protein